MFGSAKWGPSGTFAPLGTLGSGLISSRVKLTAWWINFIWGEINCFGPEFWDFASNLRVSSTKQGALDLERI